MNCPPHAEVVSEILREAGAKPICETLEHGPLVDWLFLFEFVQTHAVEKKFKST